MAISKARTHVEQLEPDDDPPWLYWVSPAEIAAGAGDCLLQLDQPDRAAVMLDEGVGMFDESLTRDRQLYSTHLADALARPGKQRDLDAAAHSAVAAIQLAENLVSARSVGRVRDLYRQLQPYAQIPAVQDFMERARELAEV